MKNVTIGFIGGGSMARSLIGGLVASGIAPDALQVHDLKADAVDALVRDFGVRAVPDNQQLLDHCDIVVLAVKPQAMKSAVGMLKVPAARKVLFVSIAAGIRAGALQRWLGGGCAIVRAMPNTPALVQSGATALYATPEVSDAQKDDAESVLRAVGMTLWVQDEAQIDAVTALSGSGPAYIFLVMEAMEKAGQQLGLTPEAAHLLTVETAFGAAKLALEAREGSAALREKVTSPGGTTEQALKVLQDGDLVRLFERAISAAHRRSVELANELGS
ncbi:MAG: pyrroline-5-carboxylate reductase [Pseudomonadota bacterium]|nr:MAG: pyrroline-5-carboxylate reductase [Pseudomonadota bacterium]